MKLVRFNSFTSREESPHDFSAEGIEDVSSAKSGAKVSKVPLSLTSNPRYSTLRTNVYV